jgi:nucleotide-binding universal stress UspA family protein
MLAVELLAGFLNPTCLIMQSALRPSVLASVASQPIKPVAAVCRGSMRRILVCVDHSQFANVALRQAVSLARTFDCGLTLLYVLQPPHEEDSPRPTDALAWDIATRQAATYLEALERETAKEGVVVDFRLEQGDPAERIGAVAGELGADLVILGSHGDAGTVAWNLGSTAEHVLAAAWRSVLIARDDSPSQDAWVPRRILVPLDGSLRTESVLPVAARLASAHNSEVLLAHVVVEPTMTAILRAETDLDAARGLATRLEGHAARYLGGLCAQLGHEGINARTVVVRHPDERQALLDLVRAHAADLVVVTAHGSTCNPAWAFGSVTAHLLAHARVPLLVMQDVPEAQDRPRHEVADESPTQLRAVFTESRT